MNKTILNPSANELVIQGWKDDVSLVEMKQILQKKGYLVNPFAIMQTWVQLDETVDKP